MPGYPKLFYVKVKIENLAKPWIKKSIFMQVSQTLQYGMYEVLDVHVAYSPLVP